MIQVQAEFVIITKSLKYEIKEKPSWPLINRLCSGDLNLKKNSECRLIVIAHIKNNSDDYGNINIVSDNSNFVKSSLYPVADPGFFRGRQPQRGVRQPIIWQNVCRKLQEMKEFGLKHPAGTSVISSYKWQDQ